MAVYFLLYFAHLNSCEAGKNGIFTFVFMKRMDKLKKIQDILHHYVNSVSSVLANFLRPVFAGHCLALLLLLVTISSLTDGHMAITTDPIFNTMPLFSIVFISLLLVSYWSITTNNNLARQKMAFSLLRTDVPKERLNRAEARCAMRCRAPFFRFR